MLVVQDLRKTFRSKKSAVEAVKGVSFAVQEGEIVGLLGPNGAGKTTIIKSILGLVRPDQGKVSVGGVDCGKRPREAARHMAAVLEGARNTYWRLTAWENVTFFAGTHGVSEEAGREYFEYLFDILKLAEKRNTEVRNLSSGYKQKVAVACALAKRTPVVFLDEPTLGLDVESSYELRDGLKRLASEEKRTIVMSSHDMRVIEDVCDRAIIMSQGAIVADDHISSLLSLFSTRKYKVTIARERTGAASAAVAGVFAMFPDAAVTETPETIEISVVLSQPAQLYELMDLLKDAGAGLEAITQEAFDLEKAFVEIVRRGNAACGQ